MPRMWIDALLAYAHYTAAFLLFAFLTVEIYLLRLPQGADIVRLLVRADHWYLGCLAAAAATGRARLRRWLMLEIHLAAVIPLFAMMMARALGR